MLDCYHLFIYKIILTSLVIDILSHNSLPNQKFVNLSTIYALLFCLIGLSEVKV